jgi:hypothetical protein
MMVKILSGKGRELLEEFDLAPNKRRHQIVIRTKDRLLSVCLLDHRDDDGTWVYRRVGVEREDG